MGLAASNIDVSIVIVSWKSSAYISKCLNSIKNSQINFKVEAIVVDNDSGDSIEDVVGKFPNVRYIQMGRNAGFGAANNRGVAEARGKYILFLNPDAVLQPDVLVMLYKELDESTNTHIGIAAPKLLNPDGSTQLSLQKSFPSVFSHLLKYNFFALTLMQRLKPGYDPMLENATQHNSPHHPAWVMGAAFMMPKVLFQRMGGFDSAFFLYYEETYLMFLLHQQGYLISYQPRAHVVHELSESIGEKNYFGQSSPYYIQSGYAYFTKVYGPAFSFILRAITAVELIFNIGVLWMLKKVPSLGLKHPFIKHGYEFSRRSLQAHFK